MDGLRKVIPLLLWLLNKRRAICDYCSTKKPENLYRATADVYSIETNTIPFWTLPVMGSDDATQRLALDVADLLRTNHGQIVKVYRNNDWFMNLAPRRQV